MDLRVSTEPTEAPTIVPTKVPVTVPPTTEPDAELERSGDAMPWVIGGIALAGVAVGVVALILKKMKK